MCVNVCEFIWIVRLSGSAVVCGSVAVCGSAAVCAQCERQFVALRVVSVQQCGPQCASVRLVASGSVWLSGSAAVCGSAHSSLRSVRITVCGSALGSMAVRTAVCSGLCALHIYTHSRSQNKLVRFPFRGSGNGPHIPRILILTDQYDCEFLKRIKVN
jgi:hypothetical protein